jgi:DNA-binding FadR family transcriptional regulator
MALKNPPSEFIQYLTGEQLSNEDRQRVPSLNELSSELGVSVARLREQMEVARVLGLVEVRPRTGIRRLPYTFYPTVRHSLFYAIALDPAYFDQFSDLRNHIEAAFWHEAVSKLASEDHKILQALMARAWEKLRGPQVQIPHPEHRQLHLTIFCRLDNPFVLGLLEAYWEAYEAIGLAMYAGIEYLQQVWQYHQEMVDAICAGDFDRGYRALVEHKDLLNQRQIATP